MNMIPEKEYCIIRLASSIAELHFFYAFQNIFQNYFMHFVVSQQHDKLYKKTNLVIIN